jgi:hypothetical protein
MTFRTHWPKAGLWCAASMIRTSNGLVPSSLKATVSNPPDFPYSLTTPPAIGQNQLQAQLIMLQSEVIMILQEAILSGRVRDMNRLYNASELAREGSLNALRDQYQRTLQAAPLRPGAVRRVSSTPLLAPSRRAAGRVRGPPPPGTKPSRARTEHRTLDPSEDGEGLDGPGPGAGGDSTSGTKVMLLDDSSPLFCRYALELQRTSEPLEARFRPGGPLACPACGTRVEVQFGRSWRVSRQVLPDRAAGRRFDYESAVEERTYLLGNRFVVKCHREQAGFACVLCARYRDKDTVCATADGLVKHVWRIHEVDEYEDDVDIREVETVGERAGMRH